MKGVFKNSFHLVRNKEGCLLSFQVAFFLLTEKLSLPLLKGANRDLIQKFFKIINFFDSGDFLLSMLFLRSEFCSPFRFRLPTFASFSDSLILKGIPFPVRTLLKNAFH